MFHFISEHLGTTTILKLSGKTSNGRLWIGFKTMWASFRDSFDTMSDSMINHCIKSVRIQSYSGPYFSALGMNTDQNNSGCGYFSSSEQVTVKHLISWYADKKYIKYELKNCFAYEKPAINLQVCHEKDALKSAQFSI